ncbi:unnamed protein product [Peronospora destructor]|uniref:Uncharacterized protein n=1 Tax=Peronospora destructor TaxID=86335 RepID=A0AAV0TIM4_9STRA|nr:unnamed protein product [Peronospora destructor]
MWLLQSHANDVVNDIEMLSIACSDSNFTVNGLELVEKILDTILTAAIIRAAACDGSAVNRTTRIAEIVNMMKGGKLMSSKARSVLRSLDNCGTHDEDAELWMKVVELPNTLDTRLFNSRSDRAFVDEASQIISLQQAELNAGEE